MLTFWCRRTKFGRSWIYAGSFIVLLAMLVYLGPRVVQACMPRNPPQDCKRVVAFTKMNSFTLVEGSTLIFYITTVTTDSGPTTPSSICTNPSTVTGGTVQVSGTCGTFEFDGIAPIAARPAGFVSEEVLVPITVTGVPNGICEVTGSADVNFSDDSAGNPATTVTATGDSVICVVEQAPGLPTIPRLAMTLGNPNPPRCGSGHQRRTTVDVRNNDPTENVTLLVTVASHQNARLASSPNGADADGVGSFSNPFSGDDNTIAFEEDCPSNGVIPLPGDVLNYTQRDISKQITIAPGVTQEIVIVNNTHPMCLDGSCFEFEFKAEGQFGNGDPVVSCVGGQLNNERGSDCPDAKFEAACCFGDGSCQNVLPFDCIDQGGVPGDAYSDCQGDVSLVNGIDDACEVDPEDRTFSLRACCFEFAPCLDLEPMECANGGGTPQLLGSTCAGSECPTFVSCCYDDGECQTLLETVCESTGGAIQARIAFLSKDTVFWPDAISNVDQYNMYRGDLSDLVDNDQDGLPDNGYGTCLGSVTGTLFVDTDIPAIVGTGFFYMLSYVEGGNEQGLGMTTSGLPRSVQNPCP